MPQPSVLSLYHRLAPLPAGRWLFSRVICLKAPYFASIAPRIESLAPGRGVATLRHRRRVSNHIGSVHAIALCNLAEFLGGLTCDVSIPPGMRWIPKGMTVEYLKKAMGTMRATATPEFAPAQAQTGYELPVRVQVTDGAGDAVFRARIAMWVSPTPPR
jgi:acyl-coenzyme A thioesterase PaaI-like protein